jgi:hypothetical protein
MAKEKTMAREEEAAETTKPVPLKEELKQMADALAAVAQVIPTPNVTDSHLHGHSLNGMARRLRVIAEEL